MRVKLELLLLCDVKFRLIVSRRIGSLWEKVILTGEINFDSPQHERVPTSCDQRDDDDDESSSSSCFKRESTKMRSNKRLYVISWDSWTPFVFPSIGDFSCSSFQWKNFQLQTLNNVQLRKIEDPRYWKYFSKGEVTRFVGCSLRRSKIVYGIRYFINNWQPEFERYNFVNVRVVARRRVRAANHTTFDFYRIINNFWI